MNRDGPAVAPLGAAAVLSPNCTTLTIELSGELDMASAGLLQCLVDGAAASGATQVRFDLTEVAFCDARGLRLLELAAADIASSGVGVAIARPSAAITRVADIDMGHPLVAIMRRWTVDLGC